MSVVIQNTKAGKSGIEETYITSATSLRKDIQSSKGPFLTLPHYRTKYPETVIEALSQLYEEYNYAFQPLVKRNRENPSDYQYCLQNDSTPANWWTQIDLAGLSHSFLQWAETQPTKLVRESLRNSIFEIDNSLAMYQLLERIFPKSMFQQRFRDSLNALRYTSGKSIALLAVTDEKYQAMKAEEVGKTRDAQITDDEVFALTGFDALMGPERFLEHLYANRDQSQYLFYVRSSDPVIKLKKPGTLVTHPLLENHLIRSIIKSHTLTLNIDNPSSSNIATCINDTKEYMLFTNMAFPVTKWEDMASQNFSKHIMSGQPSNEFSGDRLTRSFCDFLESKNVDPEAVASGKVLLRAKPMRGSYGCYGHHTGTMDSKRFRSKLRADLRKRGPYVIQPELPLSYIADTLDGLLYSYIDRVFMTCVHGKPQFLGGFRSLIRADAYEVQKGRNHGNPNTIWAEIY